MSTNASEQTETGCTCDCHEDGGCPKQTPMSTEMIKVAYLRQQTADEDNQQLSLLAEPNGESLTYPIIDDLNSLFPLLSDQGLWEWARHVFGNWTEWNIGEARGRAITHWLNEVDRRFAVPASRAETLEILKGRDGLGCVCRRSKPQCRFQRGSHYVLEDYQIAHLRPTSQGGRDVWSNLALISPSCNQSQGAREFGSWIASQTGRTHLKWRMWYTNRPKSHKMEDLVAAVGFEWRPTDS